MDKHFCTINFRKFRSVMRHVSGDGGWYHLQGVRVEKAKSKGINLIATNGVSLAFNNDPEGEIGEAFPSDGLSIKPKMAWHNATATGTIKAYNDEVVFELEGKRIAPEQSKGCLMVDDYEFPIYDEVLGKLDFSEYMLGITIPISPEVLKCFVSASNKAFNKENWKESVDPYYQFWSHKTDKKACAIVTSLDPSFIGLVMPLDPLKQYPDLRKARLLYKINAIPAPETEGDIKL